MQTINKEKYFTKIGELRKKYQKGINNLYIWTTLVLDTMEYILKDSSFFTTKHFTIPSKIKGKILKREPKQLKLIIQEARSTEIIKANFVYLVAQYESFFQDAYYYVLLYKSDLNENSINKKVIDFTYLTPYKQFSFFEQYIKTDTISKEYQQRLIELKASRDLIVHNDGIINSKYITKSGSFARAKVGDEININIGYFGDSLSIIKSIIGQITSQLQRDTK